MKKIGIVIIAIVLIAGISGTFYMVNSNSQKKIQGKDTHGYTKDYVEGFGQELSADTA